MPCNFHREAIAKFLIPDRPQEDNYPDHDELEEKEKEWEEKRDLALVQCTVWVEREQVAEAKCAVEATHAVMEKQKLRCEAVERKQKTAEFLFLHDCMGGLHSTFGLCYLLPLHPHSTLHQCQIPLLLPLLLLLLELIVIRIVVLLRLIRIRNLAMASCWKLRGMMAYRNPP